MGQQLRVSQGCCRDPVEELVMHLVWETKGAGGAHLVSSLPHTHSRKLKDGQLTFSWEPGMVRRIPTKGITYMLGA